MYSRGISRSEDEKMSDDSPYGFFIYFFDELRGHIPLFTYPPDLYDNEEEKKLISIHPIWWHQNKFVEKNQLETIDLELEGITFVATIFLSKSQRKKRRFGMESEVWKDERFVLIFKAPSSVSFIAQEILFEFKRKLQEETEIDLISLVTANLLEQSNSEIEEMLVNKIESIKKRLSEYCELLIPKGSLSRLEQVDGIQQLEKKSKKLRKLSFSIPVGKKPELEKEESIKPLSKRVKILRVERINDVLRIALRNVSSINLKNVVITLYYSQGVFAKSTQLIKIKNWMPNEYYFLEHIMKNGTDAPHFIRIEDDSSLIKLKRIIG